MQNKLDFLRRLAERLPPVTSSSGIERPRLSLPTNVRLILRRDVTRPPHTNIDAFVLLMCLAGNGRLVLDDQAFKLQPGKCILIFPRQMHAFARVRAGEIRWLFMTFQDTGEKALLPLKNRLLDFPFSSAGAELATVLRDFASRDRRRVDISARIVLNAWRLLLALAVDAGGRRRGSPVSARLELTERIQRYIHEHLDAAIYIEDIARDLYVSVSTIRAAFRGEMNRSLGRYIFQMRMRRAALLLANPDMPIKGVALNCGYSSTQVFNRAFKRSHGCTPTACRIRLLCRPV